MKHKCAFAPIKDVDAAFLVKSLPTVPIVDEVDPITKIASASKVKARSRCPYCDVILEEI